MKLYPPSYDFYFLTCGKKYEPFLLETQRQNCQITRCKIFLQEKKTKNNKVSSFVSPFLPLRRISVTQTSNEVKTAPVADRNVPTLCVESCTRVKCQKISVFVKLFKKCCATATAARRYPRNIGVCIIIYCNATIQDNYSKKRDPKEEIKKNSRARTASQRMRASSS